MTKVSDLISPHWLKNDDEPQWTPLTESEKSDLKMYDDARKKIEAIKVLSKNDSEKYFYFAVLTNNYYWPEGTKPTIEQKNALRAIFDWIWSVPGTYIDVSTNKRIEYDLTKGWLVIGTPGSGKTTMMEAFSEYSRIIQKRQFTMLYCDRDTHAAFNENKKQVPSVYYRGTRCLDELGHEKSKANVWGNQVDYIGDVLHERHRISAITHATTNVDIDSSENENLLKVYGYRIHSRLYSMFNVIYINGRDWRKPEMK